MCYLETLTNITEISVTTPRLAADEEMITAHCGDKLSSLVEDAVALRQLLRVKALKRDSHCSPSAPSLHPTPIAQQVEDGNDLIMAMDTVEELDTFNRTLYSIAAEKGLEPFSLYRQLAL